MSTTTRPLDVDLKAVELWLRDGKPAPPKQDNLVVLLDPSGIKTSESGRRGE